MDNTEIKMTDRIGDLTTDQIAHLSLGLTHAHGMTLRAAGGGRYWLDVEDGGGVLLMPSRTVEQIWKFAEVVSETDAEYKTGGVVVQVSGLDAMPSDCQQAMGKTITAAVDAAQAGKLQNKNFAPACPHN